MADDGADRQGDLRPRRAASWPTRWRSRGACTQPFIIHVAEHYRLGARALRRDAWPRPRRRPSVTRVGPAAARPRRIGRLRRADVQHPPRAGTAGGAGAGGAGAGRRRPARRAVAARVGGAAGRAGDAGRGARPSWRRSRRDGLDRLPARAVGGVADLPRRRLRRRGRRRPVAIRSTRSCCRSRERNAMIGHGVACYGVVRAIPGYARRRPLRRAGAGGAASASGAIDYNREMGADHLAGALGLRVRAHAVRAGRAGRPGRAAALAGGVRPGRADRDAGPAGPRSAGCSRRDRRRRGCRTACPRARPRSCAWSRRAGRTGRSAARCTSASTRLQTTYAASSVRPVARTAPSGNAMRTRAA